MDGMRIQSVSGGGHSGGGMFINTLDQARFGLLFAREGMWESERIISREWIEMIQKPSPANADYGYMWWLNPGNRAMKNVPDNIYYAAGFGGNYIVIDDQNDLVIVTRWLEPEKLDEFLTLIFKSL
jgi:CubicO group peptidase (beta-lactamase class C family)